MDGHLLDGYLLTNAATFRRVRERERERGREGERGKLREGEREQKKGGR